MFLSGNIWAIDDLKAHSGTSTKIEKRMQVGQVGDKEESELRDVVYRRQSPDQVYLLFRKEIHLFDLRLQLSLECIQLPSMRAEARRLYLCPDPSRLTLCLPLPKCSEQRHVCHWGCSRAAARWSLVRVVRVVRGEQEMAGYAWHRGVQGVQGEPAYREEGIGENGPETGSERGAGGNPGGLSPAGPRPNDQVHWCTAS